MLLAQMSSGSSLDDEVRVEKVFDRVKSKAKRTSPNGVELLKGFKKDKSKVNKKQQNQASFEYQDEIEFHGENDKTPNPDRKPQDDSQVIQEVSEGSYSSESDFDEIAQIKDRKKSNIKDSRVDDSFASFNANDLTASALQNSVSGLNALKDADIDLRQSRAAQGASKLGAIESKESSSPRDVGSTGSNQPISSGEGDRDKKKGKSSKQDKYQGKPRVTPPTQENGHSSESISALEDKAATDITAEQARNDDAVESGEEGPIEAASLHESRQTEESKQRMRQGSLQFYKQGPVDDDEPGEGVEDAQPEAQPAAAQEGKKKRKRNRKNKNKKKKGGADG